MHLFKKSALQSKQDGGNRTCFSYCFRLPANRQSLTAKAHMVRKFNSEPCPKLLCGACMSKWNVLAVTPKLLKKDGPLLPVISRGPITPN